MDSLVQEVEVLESIYGDDIIIYRKGASFIHGTVNRLGGGDLAITFRISPEDSEWSTNPKVHSVEIALQTRFAQIRSEPGGIYETLSHLGALDGFCGEPAKAACPEGLHEVRLFQLDHIRDQKRYCSHLEDIMRTVEGSCRLLLGKRIFILLGGPAKEVQNFIRAWKTRKVDVDAKGHPCKERMMQDLVRLQSETIVATGFEVFHYETSTQLAKYLGEKFGDATALALRNVLAGS